jgi:transcriptional regulator
MTMKVATATNPTITTKMIMTKTNINPLKKTMTTNIKPSKKTMNPWNPINTARRLAEGPSKLVASFIIFPRYFTINRGGD